MQVKETRVSQGASPFITKVCASPILSPITKVDASLFIMKAGTSPIPYIERDEHLNGASPFRIPLMKRAPS
jgi:hypothetical protein